MSWGPYKMTEFQSDKVMVFERNENWFGFNDEGGENLYQATHLRYDFVSEPATRLEMLLNGQLDEYGLTADDMDEYGTSDYKMCIRDRSSATLFPARAGVILRQLCPASGRKSFPRTRGGDPEPSMAMRFASLFSPHARG